MYPISRLGFLHKDVEKQQTSRRKKGKWNRCTREERNAMRSRVTEAKSLVTQVVTLQPLYKLKYAGICIDDVNIMYHRQSPKAELFSATTMATDHLLPFHLYFRRRENVVALHILANISRGVNTLFLYAKRSRIAFSAYILCSFVQRALYRISPFAQ